MTKTQKAPIMEATSLFSSDKSSDNIANVQIKSEIFEPENNISDNTGSENIEITRFFCEVKRKRSFFLNFLVNRRLSLVLYEILLYLCEYFFNQ